jgi:flagellar hook assembly protein FlgD
VKYVLVKADGSVIGNANEQSIFQADKMIGTINNPLVITLDIDAIEKEESKGISIYPNPFVKDINVVFSLDEKANVEASVYNVAGQKVNQLIERSLAEGNHSFTWDSVGLPAGMYHLQLVIDGTVHLFKIVKQ